MAAGAHCRKGKEEWIDDGAGRHHQPAGDDLQHQAWAGKPEGCAGGSFLCRGSKCAAAVIRAANPDIVALQEIDRFWSRSGAVDQPAVLAEMLDMEPCFGANQHHGPDEHGGDNHEYGTLILSRHPVLICQNTLLPTPGGWEQRGLLGARIAVEGIGEVSIVNTHLQTGREDAEEEAVRQREEQARAIADRVRQIGIPLVLMGDFNANPEDPELESLFTAGTGLQEAWAVAGDDADGFTCPADPDGDPENRIDYVFVSRDFTVVRAKVIVDSDAREASDHFPVVVELTRLPSVGLVTP